MPAVGIVLSRTEMSGGYFCSTVAFQRAGAWVQVRPLQKGGRNLRFSDFTVSAQEVVRLWRPGRVVTFDTMTHSDARPTHPEDHITDLSTMKFRGVTTADALAQITRQFTHQSLRDLFPNFVWQRNGKVYVKADHPQPRSLGHIPCQTVTIQQNEYALIGRRGGLSFTCKIKADDLLSQIRGGQFRVGSVINQPLIRLGLAGPNDWEGRFDPPRCYIMLTGMV
jgi:hypothetical protein